MTEPADRRLPPVPAAGSRVMLPRALGLAASVAAILVLAACSPPSHGDGAHGDGAKGHGGDEAAAPAGADTAAAPAVGASAQLGALSIAAARVRPPPGGRDVTAGYLTITSTGGADRLIAASSPEAASIELHTHTHAGGMMRMEKVEAVEIPAGGTVRFEPGGLHLMLFGVSAAASGAGPVPVTLRFESGGEVTVPFAVEPR